ncbi:hypothetical protein SH501x_000845 [Pirellulaceae bacterium SH501]
MVPKEMIAVNKAMLDPDAFVIRMRYRDKQGTLTERVVSPIKWLKGNAILALCLCRETPRRFEIDQCSDVRLVDATEVLMPVAIEVIEPAVAECPIPE